jgi:hypothetical protein
MFSCNSFDFSFIRLPQQAVSGVRSLVKWIETTLSAPPPPPSGRLSSGNPRRSLQDLLLTQTRYCQALQLQIISTPLKVQRHNQSDRYAMPEFTEVDIPIKIET